MAGKLTPEVQALALQGTLDTFSLPDVLRLLATTSKTGRLRIDGDRGLGSVWLSEGGIVDADADRAIDGTPTDEVIFELLRFDAGSFAFDGDDTASGGGEPEDVEALLRRANALLSEWAELETVVPSLTHEVTLSSDLSVEQVTIDSDRWRTLVAVASGRTVGELASALSLTELGVSRAVRDLVDLGVAEVGAPSTIAASSTPEPSRHSLLADRDRVRQPLPTPDPTGPVGPVGRPAHLTGEIPRAGWRQTGEVPAVGTDRRPAPNGNGHRSSSLDDTVATPPPAGPAPSSPPAEPPSKGGLASRLGRGRNASPSPRGGETTGSTPPVTGATPSLGASGSPRSSSRPPAAPPARTNDTGRGRTPDVGRPRNGVGDTGPVARTERPGTGAPRRPEGPNGVSSPGRPAPGPGTTAPGSSTPFDGGRLGPPPSAHDTGQIRPVTPSSLPPDLHWAADDTGGGSLNGEPTSPFSGLSSLGPAPTSGRPAGPPMNDGEIAPHVAALSAEARAAVVSTVGNSGGSTGRGGSQGEDIAQRGRLISFLSTVR